MTSCIVVELREEDGDVPGGTVYGITVYGVTVYGVLGHDLFAADNRSLDFQGFVLDVEVHPDERHLGQGFGVKAAQAIG